MHFCKFTRLLIGFKRIKFNIIYALVNEDLTLTCNLDVFKNL